MAEYASFGDPQWCAHECSNGLIPGDIDMSYRYDGDIGYDGYDEHTPYRGYDIGNHNENREEEHLLNNNILYHNELTQNKIYLLYVIIGICMMLTLYIGYYFFCKILNAITFTLEYIKTKSTHYFENRNSDNSQKITLINKDVNDGNYSSFSVLDS